MFAFLLFFFLFEVQLIFPQDNYKYISLIVESSRHQLNKNKYDKKKMLSVKFKGKLNICLFCSENDLHNL